MQKYRVKVIREITQSAYVEVTADTEDDADARAKAQAEQKTGDIDWDLESETFDVVEVDTV
jgi:DNA-dependent RNA polymerase auxiliary subunit epsilon